MLADGKRVAALPEILSDAGYETMMAGESTFCIGTDLESDPLNIRQVASRYAAARSASCAGLSKGVQPPSRCRQSLYVPPAFLTWSSTLMPDLYEPFLEDNTPAMKFMPPLYCDGPKQMTHKDIEEPFYSSTYFTDRLLGYLEARDVSKPFFAYLPYTAPHCESSGSAHGTKADQSSKLMDRAVASARWGNS